RATCDRCRGTRKRWRISSASLPHASRCIARPTSRSTPRARRPSRVSESCAERSLPEGFDEERSMLQAPATIAPAAAANTDGGALVTYDTHPDRYHHWKLAFDGSIATLRLDVDEERGIRPGYRLKLNSYDLGVDIELHDALQRIRFEHPEVKTVILASAKERIF